MDYIKESRGNGFKRFRGILFIYIFAKGMFFFRGCPVSPLHNQTRMQPYRCRMYLLYLRIYLQ